MTTTDARKRRLEDLAAAAGYPGRCTELTCPHHGGRNRALLEQVNAAHNGEVSRG